MKSPKQCEALINKLIRHAGATTPEEHACLGALLTSAGVAFLIAGNLTDAEIETVVETGKRAGRGETPLPMGREPPS